jgi:DNA-binding transcriptional MerR regulator
MTYIRVKDVEKIIDRDRNTILRWEREGKIPHPQKDSRGWRYYSEKDIHVIKKFMNAVRNSVNNLPPASI